VEKPQAVVEASVQGVLGRPTDFGRSRRVRDGLRGFLIIEGGEEKSGMTTKMGSARETYNEDVAELSPPERVDGISSSHEVSVFEVAVDVLGRLVELVENPLFDEGFLSRWLCIPGENVLLRQHLVPNQAKAKKGTLGDSAGTKSPSSLSMAKRVAFQILLAKCR
jgi:hypothetical protein